MCTNPTLPTLCYITLIFGTSTGTFSFSFSLLYLPRPLKQQILLSERQRTQLQRMDPALSFQLVF
jgi:hypothetical protein